MILALAILLFSPLLICWGLWFLFALLAALPHKKTAASNSAPLFPIDILIPAHNEELLLPLLLESLRDQTKPELIHAILVVADHCTDRTAALARHAGVSLLERRTGPHGKPAALRAGLAHLTSYAALPATQRAILILDADCTVSPNLVASLAAAFTQGRLVAQAAYFLEDGRSQKPEARSTPPTLPTSNFRLLSSVSSLAFALKNVIRPAGMARLGLPTQLFGTGMCFRADVLDVIPFEDHLTEDLAMSHELLLRNIRPAFIRDAVVRSPVPPGTAAMTTQKLRWETGQLSSWKKIPPMLTRLIVRGNLRGALALLDWSAPPVALAVLYWLGATFAMVLLVVFTGASAWTLLLSALAALCLTGYVIVGGIQVAGFSALARLLRGAPRFALWKGSLYARMLAGQGAKSWQRTPRETPQSAARK